MNSKQIKSWLTVKKNSLDRLYRARFHRIPPRPNFNEIEVTITTVNEISTTTDGVESSVTSDIAIFPTINGLEAQQNGWVDNIWKYKFLAGLMFSRRYPNHPLSQSIRKGLSLFDDETVEKIGTGELRLRVKPDNGNLQISTVPGISPQDKSKEHSK